MIPRNDPECDCENETESDLEDDPRGISDRQHPEAKGIHMFVVIIGESQEHASTAPRAVGPFDTFDQAQAFSLTLDQKWQAEDGAAAPTATVVHVEEAYPGVVVGEL